MRIWAGLVLVFGFSLVAKADTSYPVSGTVDGFSGQGTLYVESSPNRQGGYVIVGVDGPGVTGLLPVSQFHGNDNLLDPGTGTLLDANGFAFTDTMGDTGFEVSLFSTGAGTYGAHILDSDGVGIDDAATFTVGSAEPQSSVQRTAMLRAGALDGADLTAYSFQFGAAPAVAATPEPGSCALVGTGLLGAATLAWRRRRLQA